jgi:hypothetical protein
MMTRRTMALGAVASGAAVALPHATLAAADLPVLDLPAPAHQGGRPLMEVLTLRRSTRAAIAATPLRPVMGG